MISYSEKSPFWVVGVAASAGGLEALSRLLKHLRPHPRLSVVIAQHLSPDHESLLVNLLSRESKMPVSQARDQLKLIPGEVVVIPAGHNGTFSDDGRLQLSPTKEHGVPKPSANQLFHSMSIAFPERSIGVVLSGTGSDGANGGRDIKAQGGFMLVQSLDQAKYASMPSAAIETGCVDRIAQAETIASELGRIAEVDSLSESSSALDEQQDSLNQVLDALYQRSGVDFRQYKENTLKRRVARRFIATNTATLDEYGQYIKQFPEELDVLYQDLLISVTAFFRDQPEFEQLREILAEIIDKKQDADDLRIWVAGCATGEEAYSIAIIISEILGPDSAKFKTTIFATDIDNKALAIARRGGYSTPALKDIPERLKEKYFSVAGEDLIVDKRIREMVVFARQNMIQDAPFLRLDLVTCRNVLIYMKNDLQARVESNFHFALAENGVLFLGKSESLPVSDLFDPLPHSKGKFFRRRNVEGQHPAPTIRSLPSQPTRRPSANASKTDEIQKRVGEALIEHFLPAGILVDVQMDIRFIFGDIQPYTAVASGQASLNLQNLLLPELQLDARSLIFKAQNGNQEHYTRTIHRKNSDIRMELIVLDRDEQSHELFLLRLESFPHTEFETEVSSISDSDNDLLSRLDQELASTREHLQTVIEELETSNEELQAVNEELQSSNEELQSTNEEMETANEELQSTNEELTTVNEELQIKSAEVVALNTDLGNIKDALPAALIVLDQHGRLTHFNPAAREIFEIDEAALGLFVSYLPSKMPLPDISGLLENARNGEKSEIQITGDRSYWLSVNCYFDQQGDEHGAVLLFWDNTELLDTYKRLEESLVENNIQARALEAAEQGILIVDARTDDLPIVYVNPAFTSMTGFDRTEVVTRNCRFLQGEDSSEETINEIRQTIATGASGTFTILNYRKDGTPFWNQLSLSPIFDNDGALTHFISLQSDITEWVESERDKRLAKVVYQNTLESIVILDSEGRIISNNPAFSKLVDMDEDAICGREYRDLIGHDPEDFKKLWSSLSKQGAWQGELHIRTLGQRALYQWVSISAMDAFRDKDRTYVCIASDISELKHNEVRLNELAHYDSLTGLPNRLQLGKDLRTAISRANRRQDSFVVLFIDIDNFKLINDSFGHEVGDEVLKFFTGKLQSLMRETDTLARNSGDEFVALLEGDIEAGDAQQFAMRVLRTLESPFLYTDQKINISASIGIAVYPHDGDSVDMLLRNADAAMYRSKQEGRARYSFADVASSEKLQRQLRLESDLRSQLNGENIGLCLHYQPVIELSTNRLTGFEALLRWQHPEFGLLMPGDFLPYLRTNQLLEQLDFWVIKQVIRQRKIWNSSGKPYGDLIIAVNLSPSHLEDVFERRQSLVDYLSSFRQQLDWMQLEILEDRFIPDSDNALEVIQSLRNLGVRIALDDFGAGYSNLSYLKRSVSVDTIKLDRSLITGVIYDERTHVIVENMVRLFEGIAIDCVAEGVEDREVMQKLIELGVNYAQGYHIGYPTAPEELDDLCTTYLESAEPVKAD